MSETKVMAQKKRCAQNCRKSMSLPLAASVASDNSPLEHDGELFEPSKDS